MYDQPTEKSYRKFLSQKVRLEQSTEHMNL